MSQNFENENTFKKKVSQMPPSQSFSVCLPEGGLKKKFSLLKFASSNNVDFTTFAGSTKIERENNLKEFKSAYDIDQLPKSGAGSEYGREQREEARKKKYGIKIKKYNPQDQPWLLRMGSGKQMKRFRGTKNGGIMENASYFIFMPSSDSKFLCQQVEDWYDFIPQAKYKALNAEEAEQEFSRRDKTYNHFAIMLNKRMKQGKEEGDEEEEEEGEGGKKKKKINNNLLISEFDQISDDNEDDEDWEDETNEETKNNKNKNSNKNNDSDNDDINNDNNKKNKNKSKKLSKKKKKKKKNEEDEEEDGAMEESDELDEGREVDYISGSSSNDEDMYDDNDGLRSESSLYKDRGVEEEEGLRKLVGSDEEDDEDDEEKKDDDIEDEEDNNKHKEGKNNKNDSDSDDSSSSDLDKESYISNQKAKLSQASLSISSSSSPFNSSLNQKSNDFKINDVKKRKIIDLTDQMNVKKTKTDQASSSTSPLVSPNNLSTLEDVVRRYLSRKPTTTKELLHKLNSKHSSITQSLSREQLSKQILNIFTKLKPTSYKTNGKMYFTTNNSINNNTGSSNSN